MFVIDTSALVQAQNLYYAHDIVPGFWNLLISLHQDGKVVSIDKVQSEINNFYDPNDPLRQWIKTSCPPSIFSSTSTSSIVSVYSQLMAWITNQPQYKQSAIDEFARAADGWVIAYAKENGCTVVSMEVSAPSSRKVAKLPDICSAHVVDHINTYEFLRRVEARFT